MTPRKSPAAYAERLRDLADQIERDESVRPPIPDDTPADVEMGTIVLGEHGTRYRWSVRSSYGVVKVWSSRDSCMLALGPERAREVGTAFAAAMHAAAAATERAERGEPRMEVPRDAS